MKTKQEIIKVIVGKSNKTNKNGYVLDKPLELVPVKPEQVVPVIPE